MISFFRGLVPALLGLALLGVVGCGENNEDFVKAQAAANANKPQAAPDPNALPPPKSQEEYGKQRQQQQKAALKSAGYPGAK
jgi:hypothetical protein